MPAKDESVIAFTRTRAAELSGLSLRQLDYWRKTHLFEPSTSEQLSPYRAIHIYNFPDMLELLTIAQLLERDVPTKRIRKIVDRMRAQGVERPLSEIKYGVAERRVRKDGKLGRLLVLITFEDGTTEGDDDPGQMIVQGSVNVSEIRATLRRSTERTPDAVGQIERRLNTLGSKELFKGTRIPVATVKRYLAEGVPVAEILEAYPALKVEDVEAVRRVG